METLLSPREKEVIEILHENPDTKYIATKLFIAPTTVKTHITNIAEKLNISGYNIRAKILIKTWKGA